MRKREKRKKSNKENAKGIKGKRKEEEKVKWKQIKMKERRNLKKNRN